MQALKPSWERMLLAVAACSVLREKPIGGIYIQAIASVLIKTDTQRAEMLTLEREREKEYVCVVVVRARDATVVFYTTHLCTSGLHLSHLVPR